MLCSSGGFVTNRFGPLNPVTRRVRKSVMHSPRSLLSIPRRRWLGLLGIAPLLQACSPLRLINATVPSHTHTVRRDLAYGNAERQRADVYLPAPALAGAPIAVFFYGGSWSSGARADYRFVGEALASRGIVTVVADYRLSPEVRYPVFLQDCAQAVRWAREQATAFGASRERLFIVGHSAGAYNAAMLALDPRWLGREPFAGWAGLAGPYDFLPIGNPEVKIAFEWPGTPADSQPLFQALAQGTPKRRALLLAARNDSLVNPQRNTVALAQTLKRQGTPVEVELFDRVSHTTLIGALAPPLRGLAPVLDRLGAFLNQPTG